jgi:Fic family protein
LSVRNDLPPVERAITAYFQLLMIHPFRDANGRTARTLFLTDLIRCGVPLEQALDATILSQNKRFLFAAALSKFRRTDNWGACYEFWSESMSGGAR